MKQQFRQGRPQPNRNDPRRDRSAGKNNNNNNNRRPDHRSNRNGAKKDPPPHQQQGRHHRNATKDIKDFVEAPPKPKVMRRYGVVVYETFAAAKQDLEVIKTKASEVDQLNIVIKAEGNMDDAELCAIEKVKVFAGSAWALIHERRLADGWYNEPHE